jgi:hypothetical protein
MQQLSNITPENLFQFMMGNPEIVPEPFRKNYWKNVKDLGIFLGVCTIGGTVSNIVLSRTVPRLLILPNYIRIPLRFAIFGLPFLAGLQKIKRHYNLNGEML